MTNTVQNPAACADGRRFGLILLIVAVVLQALALYWFSFQRHGRFESGEDLALFDQMLWNVRHGSGLLTTLSGNSYLQFLHHYYGEHVVPICYVLAWPAALSCGPEALLLLQALAFALAAFPLRRLTVAWTGSERLGLGAALVWLLQPAMWSATLYDFHPEAFEGLFLFSFVYMFMRRHWSSVLWAALYVSCKEDAPIYLAAVAGLLGWKFRQWRWGLPLAGAAFLYALAAVLWIGPAFSPTHKLLLANRLLTLRDFGGLWPWVQGVLLHPDRWSVLIVYLFALGFLPLLGGRLLLPAGMAVGVMWVSRADPQALIQLHYPQTVHPLLVLAALAGLQRFHAFTRNTLRASLQPWALGGMVCLLVSGLAWGWHVNTALGSEVCRGRDAAQIQIDRAADKLLSELPAGQLLTASPVVVSHLVTSSQMALVLGPGDADWLVLLRNGLTYPFRTQDYTAWMNSLLATNSAYGVYAIGGNRVVVLKSGYSKALNAQAARTEWWMPATSFSHKIGHAAVAFGSQNGLVWEAGRRDRQDYVLFGNYCTLLPGRYRVGFRVKASKLNTANPVVFDISEQGGRILAGEKTLDRPTDGFEWLELEISIKTGEDVEFRCLKTGCGNLQIDTVRYQLLD